MKPRSYNYFRLLKKLPDSMHQCSFESLAEFKRFADSMNLKNIYLIAADKNDTEKFAVIDNGVMLYHDSMNFKSIEDYSSAQQAGFADATLFYKAKEEGYHSYDDYALVLEAGISDINIFKELKAQGYINGYYEYLQLLNADDKLPEIGTFESAYQLYSYGIKNGFNSYNEFKEAITKGFIDKALFKVAASHGFPTFADYEDGRQRGFRTYVDLKYANENKVRHFEDLKRLVDLEKIICDNCMHDQKLMLIILSKLEQGKKVSINKLTDLLQKAIDEYIYPDTGELPLWFAKAFNGNESMIDFLQKNTQVKKYGVYDNEGEFFQLNLWQNRSVVIDASNVAHSSMGNGKSKPKASNIHKMVDFLKEKGFSEMYVIADASLKHRIIDNENMPALKKATQYMEAPGETSADAFLIEYVKRNNCLLVSNDTFRDWKSKDSWVAQNIDYYRLPFMMDESGVLMPDLKEGVMF